jgi:hypothetical protein
MTSPDTLGPGYTIPASVIYIFMAQLDTALFDHCVAMRKSLVRIRFVAFCQSSGIKPRCCLWSPRNILKTFYLAAGLADATIKVWQMFPTPFSKPSSWNISQMFCTNGGVPRYHQTYRQQVSLSRECAAHLPGMCSS